jgi:lysophospholipase L1-like esterase
MHYIHYVVDKEGWRGSEEALRRMRDNARKAGARFVVVVFPVEQQLRTQERRAQEELMKFAANNNIEVLDLYSTLQARWREGLYIDYFGGAADKLHLNERGHRVVAEQIGAFLLEHRTDLF